MTTTINVMKTCAICNNVHEYCELGSTSILGGSSDLDLRPPPLARFTIYKTIQMCPSCGYCTYDVSQMIDNAQETIHGALYQQQLHNKEFPKTTNHYLCYSMLLENAGDYIGAAQASIYAAWTCDDGKRKAIAKKCRVCAIRLMLEAKKHGQKFAEQDEVEGIVMVDLLRRAGRFKPALEECDKALEKSQGKAFSDILEFQKMLISRKDITCHQISEIRNSRSGPEG